MSIRSFLGNTVNVIGDTASSVINSARITLENIVGTVTTGFSTLWEGGFTGMSAQGVEDLKSALQKYCGDIEGIISGFDQTGDISSALKGDAQQAAIDFIDAIKAMLEAWVTQIKANIAELEEAYKLFSEDNKSIAQDIQQAASDIRQNAEQIRLD